MNLSPNSAYYEIRFQGHLGERRARWFEGMEISQIDNGDTLLRGPLPDQSALHGMLNRIRDLGLVLVSVRQISPPPPENQ